MSEQIHANFSEAMLADLGPFLMSDPEKFVEVNHPPTATRKAYTTYKVVVRPRDYEPAMFEVEVFKRTLERMRMLQYTRKDKLIVATLKPKVTPEAFDEIILSLGGFEKK